MAFNPNEPKNGEEVDADVLRSQFNALNDRITALPVSQPETDPIVGAVTGIVKADGAGHISAAAPGADYVSYGAYRFTGFLPDSPWTGAFFWKDDFRANSDYGHGEGRPFSQNGRPIYTGWGGLMWLVFMGDHWQLEYDPLAGGRQMFVNDARTPEAGTWRVAAGGMTDFGPLVAGTCTLTEPATYLPETDPVVGAVTGLVKADGAGHITAATPGTDYLAPVPAADGTYPVYNDGVTPGQVTGFTVSKGLITAVTTVP